jgi:AcrR family transcriptional regulator
MSVGNREELLAGARKCLLEKGYVQTTARDIASASGVSLAAIGYHFGTKEALLQEAMVEANIEWGQRIDRAAATLQVPEDEPFPKWFEHCWGRIIAASREDQRLLQASIEVLLNVDQDTPVCSSLSNGMQCARDALAEMFGHGDDTVDAEEANAVGAFYHALMIGVRLLHAATPERAPGPHDITLAMRAISRKFCEKWTEADPGDG